MTGWNVKSESRPSALLGVTPGQFCFGFFSLFCLLLILRNSDVAIAYMNQGLSLCVKTVIPSLFPFIVLSELIVSGGITERLLKPIVKPLCKLFKISETGCCAVILGMFCGFPIGSKSAMTALDYGKISKNEAERIICFSGNPSSAFLISAVGGSLWGNRAFGIALYCVILFSEICTGIFLRYTVKDTQPSDFRVPESPIKRKSGAGFFTQAVQSATAGMLLICAYVVFFCAIVGTLGLVLDAFSCPEFGKTIIFCLFELSGGVSTAATLGSPLLIAFAAGWSGLSIHCQVLAICDGHGLSFRNYFLAKAAQSLLVMILFWGVLKWLPWVL